MGSTSFSAVCVRANSVNGLFDAFGHAYGAARTLRAPLDGSAGSVCSFDHNASRGVILLSTIREDLPCCTRTAVAVLREHARQAPTVEPMLSMHDKTCEQPQRDE